MKIQQNILNLEKAKQFVSMPEIFYIFYADWHAITEVEYDALKYLVENKSRIILPNVKSLSQESLELIRGYKANYIEIGVEIES
jgi:hypothetical protein